MSASVDAHVAVSSVTLAAVDFHSKVDQTALDRHDGEIGRFRHEHGVDRRQAAEEVAGALPDHLLVGHNMDPEITGQGNAGLSNRAHGDKSAGHATLHVGRTPAPQSPRGSFSTPGTVRPGTRVADRADVEL